MTTTMPVAVDQARGLRAMADMIESHPALAGTGSYMRYLPIWWATDADQLVQIARAGLAHGATVDKIYSDDTFVLTLTWGRVTAYAYADRAQVCTRVVTGTREVTRTVPDPDAPRVEVTEVVEDVRWDCAPLLASTVAGAA